MIDSFKGVHINNNFRPIIIIIYVAIFASISQQLFLALCSKVRNARHLAVHAFYSDVNVIPITESTL